MFHIKVGKQSYSNTFCLVHCVYILEEARYESIFDEITVRYILRAQLVEIYCNLLDFNTDSLETLSVVSGSFK